MSQDEDGGWKYVPDARPITVVPVDRPTEVDGFRIARPFDGTTEDLKPRISPERGYITDPAERERLLRYLKGGARGFSSIVHGADLLDPRRRFAVSATLRTDGVWIWHGSAEYYLRWHNVAPEPDFYRHIVAHDYRPPTHVPPEILAAAERADDESYRVYRERAQSWLRDRDLLIEGDESRFPYAVSEKLLMLGWRRGRHATDLVDPWLNLWTERLKYESDLGMGYPPYEPLSTATAVLYEFGGLISRDDGQISTGKKIPFAIYPHDPALDFPVDPGVDFDPAIFYGWDNIGGLMYDVGPLAHRLGKRLFQVGHVDDPATGLLVAEDGKVYTVGDQELLLGDTFDEALIAMLEGHPRRPIPGGPGLGDPDLAGSGPG